MHGRIKAEGLDAERERFELITAATILHGSEDSRQLYRVIEPKYFRNAIARGIFETARTIYQETGAPASILNVAAAGGMNPADLAGLTIEYSEPAGVPILIQRIVQFHTKELLADLGTELKSEDLGPAEALDRLQAVARDCHRAIEAIGHKTKTEQALDVEDYFERKASGQIRPIATGFEKIDNALKGGLSDGGLSFLVGMGGSGKTSFALQIALRAAREGMPVHFFEGEMTSPQLHARATRQTTGDEPERNSKALSQWLAEYERLPLRFDILTERTPAKLLGACEAAREQGARLIVVDYLQAFKGVPGEMFLDNSKEFQAIKYLSWSLRAFALKSGVHVLAISMRNRTASTSGRLSLGNLFGGANLEHDCTEAFSLESPEGLGEDTLEEMRTGRRAVNLEIMKARDAIHGGPFPLTFHLTAQRFTEGRY